jgi:endonuclease-3 related protein
MPGLSDCFDQVLSALPTSGSQSGAASPLEGGGPGARLLAACIQQVVGDGGASRLIEALKAAGWLDPQALATQSRDAIAERVRDATGKTVGPRNLQILLKMAAVLSRLDDQALMACPTSVLRDLLRGVRGLGPGTVDTILLEALDRPVFPVTAGRFRILARHGWLDPWATYDEATDTVGPLAELEPDPTAALGQLTQGMDQVARRWCKTTRADCSHCPLEPFLPSGGPNLDGIETDTDDG